MPQQAVLGYWVKLASSTRRTLPLSAMDGDVSPPSPGVSQYSRKAGLRARACADVSLKCLPDTGHGIGLVSIQFFEQQL